MVEYVNMIIRNEDVQGREETFGTWQAALEKAIYDAENRNISWKEAKKHRVEIWMHETETDEMELYEVVPFVRKWNVDVLAWMDMDDVTDEVQFKVYPVDDRGERLWYEKAIIFDK